MPLSAVSTLATSSVRRCLDFSCVNAGVSLLPGASAVTGFGVLRRKGLELPLSKGLKTKLPTAGCPAEASPAVTSFTDPVPEGASAMYEEKCSGSCGWISVFA